MIKLEFTVDVGQKLMEVVFICSVRERIHIQEGTISFMKNGFFNILIKYSWHPRWETGIFGKVCCGIYHIYSPGLLKIQRVHISFS